MLTLFTPRRSRSTRPEPIAQRAGVPAPEPHSYLTDGDGLYRMLGRVARGACELIGMENCRSLEIVLVPIADLRRGRMPAVAPAPSRAGAALAV
jgi:hypothetical protein